MVDKHLRQCRQNSLLIPVVKPNFANFGQNLTVLELIAQNCLLISLFRLPLRISPPDFSSYRPFQLAAGSVNVSAARTPDERWDSSGHKDRLKLEHAFMNGHGEGNTRPGVERNQVHLAGNVFDPGRDLASVFRAVIHPFKQNVFERQPLAWTPCGPHELASRIEQ
jgi:hypothetical protein